MELALEMKFYLDFHWVTRAWRRTLTNGSDVKYVFPLTNGSDVKYVFPLCSTGSCWWTRTVRWRLRESCWKCRNSPGRWRGSVMTPTASTRGIWLRTLSRIFRKEAEFSPWKTSRTTRPNARDRWKESWVITSGSPTHRPAVERCWVWFWTSLKVHRAQRSYFACFVMWTLYIDLHEGRYLKDTTEKQRHIAGARGHTNNEIFNIKHTSAFARLRCCCSAIPIMYSCIQFM